VADGRACGERVALVTGAGSGIGQACVLGLLRDGWSVALAGRTEESLRQSVAGWPDERRVLLFPADVSDPGSVSALFDAILGRFGHLDLLFNNAGVAGPHALIEDVDVDEWQQTVAINLSGTFFCIQAAFRLMKDQDPRGGRIVNNGSVAAHTPRLASAAYAATKHAITGLTKAASLEGRAFNIACGQIDIGNARTPMLSLTPDTETVRSTGGGAAEPTMDVVHVVNALLYMANLPLDANVQSMMVMATAMPFIGRG
jgi:NAD(P)-dependent dehydrogenase (short-subunit alcohol dehydrogenase family)